MIIEIIIALIIGIIAGTITGLTPGIHINLIALITISFSETLLKITTPIILAIFITSMAITHTFLDFIPSIFLGAPNEDSFLSVLPGHKLLLEGRGYYAIIFTLYGSLSALFIILFFTPFFIFLVPFIYSKIQKIIPFILIIVCFLLIYSDKEKKISSFFIFLMAGFLGIASLNLNVKEPLLPLLTGLFGASNLIISINQKTIIPEQRINSIKNIKLSINSILKSSLASMISAPFTAFLPAIGTAQSALIGRYFLNIRDQREFLFLIGAVNTIMMGLSFITLYSINKTRTGASAAISQLIPELTLNHLFIIGSTIIISGFLSFIIAVNISKIASKNIHKIAYHKLSKIILYILILMIFIFSDNTFEGRIISLLIFITSTSLGIFTISSNIKRMHLMGCLLVPTILFYLL
ncbi:MAG: tripartite tricarboxylate transporter permease [Nanoarchaeota archaeon]